MCQALCWALGCQEAEGTAGPSQTTQWGDGAREGCTRVGEQGVSVWGDGEAEMGFLYRPHDLMFWLQNYVPTTVR